jgi:GNAT superfamily N-acetyltransferase
VLVRGLYTSKNERFKNWDSLTYETTFTTEVVEVYAEDPKNILPYLREDLHYLRGKFYQNKLQQLMKNREALITDISAMHVIRMAVKENALSNHALITPSDYEEFLFTRGKGWVAEIDSTIIGFAICDLREENIWALFVHPDHEGKGVARALQKEMLDCYFTQKEYVWLGTAPGTRAEKFYRASGWKENGMHGKEIKFELAKADWLNSQV